MGLVVQKYGGSSLASPRHIRAAAKRIRNLKATGSDVVVVVSAMGRTTDHLIRLAHKTVKEPLQRELDMLMTAGERVSMSLLAMALHEEGVKAISFTGSQSGIVTSSEHTDAKIIDVKAFRIQEEIAKGRVVIVAGFQGISREKEITTLGRGGSDTTAVAIAASLNADLCEILTDVDGICTADPRLVRTARLISLCSYDEALELSSLGAKMQSRSIELARRFEVKVRVTNSRSEGTPGTEIRKVSKEDNMEATKVRGIATQDGFHFFRVKTDFNSFVSWVRTIKVPLRFFQSNGTDVSFLCEEDRLPLLAKQISQLGEIAEEAADLAIVSVVGDGVGRCPDFLGQFVESLHASDCPPKFIVSNALSITTAVPSKQRQVVAQALHDRFLSEPV